VEEEEQPVISSGDTRTVRHLTLAYFRSRLVEHFDILRPDGRTSKVTWPKRK
jgi:hypothetical protein